MSKFLKPHKSRRLIYLLFGLGWMGLFVLFGFLYYEQYYKWRGCLNELGRCFDAETGVVFLEQSGVFWLSLTAICLAISIHKFWNFKKLSHKAAPTDIVGH